MWKKLDRIYRWIRAAIFTLVIHGLILYVLIFGLLAPPEKIKTGGKPIQATTVNQQQLDREKQQKVEQQEQLEKKRKEEKQKKLEQEKKKKEDVKKQKQEQEKKKQEQENQRKQEQEQLDIARRRNEIKKNCVELVSKEEISGETNQELDDLCEKERADLKKRKVDEKQLKIKKEKERKAAAEKKKKQEADKKRKKEAEKKRKADEEKKRKLAAEKKRKTAEEKKRKQALQAQVEAERQQQLAAQTKREAANALQAAAGRIKVAIENNWRRPGASLIGLKATIQLKVARNGNVLSARIISSSGDPFFDQSAENAVKKASPLPIPTNPKYYEYLNEFNIEFNPDE